MSMLKKKLTAAGIEENRNKEVQKLLETAQSHSLPQMVINVIIAAGYESIQAVTSLDDVSSIEKFMQTSFGIFSEDERAVLYGRFVDCPQNFVFLPGHKSQLLQFANVCKKILQAPIIKKPLPVQKRGRKPKVTTTFVAPVIKSKPPKERVVTSECSQSDLPPKLAKIQKKIKEWCSYQEDKRISQLTENVHYEIVVSALNLTADKKLDITKTVKVQFVCLVCSKKISLPYLRFGFSPSNVFRHIRNCGLEMTPQKSKEVITPKPKKNKKEKGKKNVDNSSNFINEALSTNSSENLSVEPDLPTTIENPDENLKKEGGENYDNTIYVIVPTSEDSTAVC